MDGPSLAYLADLASLFGRVAAHNPRLECGEQAPLHLPEAAGLRERCRCQGCRVRSSMFSAGGKLCEKARAAPRPTSRAEGECSSDCTSTSVTAGAR